MAAASISDEMLLEANFRTLGSAKTKPEAFTTFIDEHVTGYTQKKRVVDGLKDLNLKVDSAENKFSVMRAVGKAKKLEPEEQVYIDNYNATNLKEKVKILNDQISAMLEAGKVTEHEKPLVLHSLNERLTAAKAGNKEKLIEKLEKQIRAVSKATPIDLPVANIKELDALTRKITEIEAVEKKPAKSHTAADKERLETKQQFLEDLKVLEAKSRMWFESEFEFKPRLSKALTVLALNEAEQRKKEEAEAWERKLKEEQDELERKKKEAQLKHEEAERKMNEKLEARRLEAAAKPVKEIPKAKPKAKKQAKRMNPLDIFNAESQAEKRMHEPDEPEEPVDDDDEASELPSSAATPQVSPQLKANATPQVSPMLKASAAPAGYPSSSKLAAAPAAASAVASSAPAAAAAAPAKEPEKPKPKKEKVVLENKWGDVPAALPAAAVEEDGGEGGEEEDDTALPSLAAAAKASKETVKKTPPPQPKKKGTKKFSKISAVELGFDANNPNYVN